MKESTSEAVNQIQTLGYWLNLNPKPQSHAVKGRF